MDLPNGPLKHFKVSRGIVLHGDGSGTGRWKPGRMGRQKGARGQADAQKSGTTAGSKMKSPPMGGYAMAR